MMSREYCLLPSNWYNWKPILVNTYSFIQQIFTEDPIIYTYQSRAI